MGLIINGNTQFKTDGYRIDSSELNKIYLDIQWITPKGTDTFVQVRFMKFEDETMQKVVTAKIDGIPEGTDTVDITPYIQQAGSLMALTVDLLHDAVIDKMVLDYPDFDGHITKYDPFAP